MDLEIKGQALLKNVNIRREFHGEEVELGVDLRLVLKGDADDLVHFGAALKSLLYADGGELRLPYLKPLHLSCEFKDHTLHIADMSFDGAVFGKFVITPEIEGKVELAFNVAMSQAPLECLVGLAALLLEERCNIDIEPMQGALELEGEAA